MNKLKPSILLQHPDYLVLRIIIDVDSKRVWRALTESEYTCYYLYGSRVNSSWETKSEISFSLEIEGQEQNVVEGYILDIQPNKLLKHSLFPSGANYPNTINNHLEVSYELLDLADKTELIINQSGFQRVAEGEKRYGESIRAWDHSLPLLKEIAESIT